MRIFCSDVKFARLITPPTMTLTAAVMLRTRMVSKYVSRFLFVGRMEKKKLERAKQERLETRIFIVQAAQLKIILKIKLPN